MWIEHLATLATALFAGASLYVSLVEHPARMSCGPAVALAQFRPSYRRATPLQASLAVAGALLGLAAWLTGGGLHWLIAAVLLGSVVPFTLIVIFPTNRRLEDPALDGASAATPALLTAWGRLHGVRTALSLLALGLMIFA